MTRFGFVIDQARLAADAGLGVEPILYSHFLLDGRFAQEVLFTRLLNPVWTYAPRPG